MKSKEKPGSGKFEEKQREGSHGDLAPQTKMKRAQSESKQSDWSGLARAATRADQRASPRRVLVAEAPVAMRSGTAATVMAIVAAELTTWLALQF